MSLNAYTASRVVPLLKGARVLCLGYPDLDMTAEEAGEVFGKKPTKFFKREAAHSFRQGALPETSEMFLAHCKTFDCVDMGCYTGIERVADLNYPQKLGEYDLVLDLGTLEHCFNVGQGMINAASSVAHGGRILHINPISMVNHGFYNLNPTLYWDFYTQNGWKMEWLEIHDRKDGQERRGDAMQAHDHRMMVKPEAGIWALAKRQGNVALRYPVQEKYRKLSFESRRAA